MQKQKKKDSKKKIINGRVYIQATFNNTIVTVADQTGSVLCWSSSGSLGFKGVKKSTPYAAQTTTETALKKASDYGIERVAVYVKGPGAGRESAIRAIVNLGIAVVSINDLTAIPHNGCRPPKVRHP